jgi:hypothetical protein
LPEAPTFKLLSVGSPAVLGPTSGTSPPTRGCLGMLNYFPATADTEPYDDPTFCSRSTEFVSRSGYLKWRNSSTPDGEPLALGLRPYYGQDGPLRKYRTFLVLYNP